MVAARTRDVYAAYRALICKWNVLSQGSRTSLFDAVESGDLKVVKNLIYTGVDHNIRDMVSNLIQGMPSLLTLVIVWCSRSVQLFLLCSWWKWASHLWRFCWHLYWAWFCIWFRDVYLGMHLIMSASHSSFPKMKFIMNFRIWIKPNVHIVLAEGYSIFRVTHKEFHPRLCCFGRSLEIYSHCHVQRALGFGVSNWSLQLELSSFAKEFLQSSHRISHFEANSSLGKYISLKLESKLANRSL